MKNPDPITTGMVGEDFPLASTRKDNDTRFGMNIAGQDPDTVEMYVETFQYGLKLIYAAHMNLRLDADKYTAVWDKLESHQRTALRKILTELPG